MRKIALCATAAACGALSSVSAHHSDIAYYIADRSAEGGETRIEGTATRVRLINPHSEILIDVENVQTHETEHWVVETDSWNQLRGVGWEQDWVEAGDRVAVIVAMSRQFEQAGRIRDLLVYEPEQDVSARLFLEYIPDSEDEMVGLGSVPERLLEEKEEWLCPEYTQIRAGRPPGKEMLLCFELDQSEFERLRKEYGQELAIFTKE